MFACAFYSGHKTIPVEDESSIESLLSEFEQSPGGSVATESTLALSFQLSDMTKDTLLGEFPTNNEEEDDEAFDFVMPWEDPRREKDPTKLEFRPIKDYMLRPGEKIRIRLPGQGKATPRCLPTANSRNLLNPGPKTSEAADVMLRASTKDTRSRWSI